MSSYAPRPTWYSIERCRVLFVILHGTLVGFFEFLIFYMGRNWELPNSARHSTWYRSGRSLILLYIFHRT